MITNYEFHDDEYKDTAIVYKSMLKQVYQVAMKQPEKAGELAISFLEKVLSYGGKIKSDDATIELIMSGYDPVVERATERYNQQVAVKMANSVEKYHYKELVEMKRDGVKQGEIARKLGFKNQQSVSYHWGVIQAKYPELISKIWPEKARELAEGAKNFTKKVDEYKKTEEPSVTGKNFQTDTEEQGFSQKSGQIFTKNVDVYKKTDEYKKNFCEEGDSDQDWFEQVW